MQLWKRRPLMTSPHAAWATFDSWHARAQMEVAYRPSHADATYDFKYGIRAVAGGGRSSARETIGRVAAGAVAKKLLSQLAPGIEVCALVHREVILSKRVASFICLL